MITNKYDYQQLTRKNIDGSRHYIIDGNKNSRPVPSVTTILDATKSDEDIALLANWKKRVGQIQANNVVLEASSRGTRMHKYLELYALSADNVLPATGSNPHAKQAHKMAVKVVKEGMTNVSDIFGVEIPLYHPNIYGGTTDLVGIHKMDEAIVDFKQSNKPKKIEWIESYFTQLAAYGEAHNELHNTKIRKGVIMMCTPDLEYQEFIIEGNTYDKYKRLWWDRVEQYYMLCGELPRSYSLA